MSIGAAAAWAGPPSPDLRLGAYAPTGNAVVDQINGRLRDQVRKFQCSFNRGTDVLEPGCDAKLAQLALMLVDVRKQLAAAQVRHYHFEVSGHTDSSGDAAKNKSLSQKQAAVIVKALVARGVPAGEIVAVGMGSALPLVKPDDTAAKKALNRRFEVIVRP